MLEALLRRKPKQERPNPVLRLGGEVGIEIDPTEFTSLNSPYPHEYSLETAKEFGVQPLTLNQVLAQIDQVLHDNIVLFDTSPTTGIAGNHFRLVRDEEGKKKLQLTSTFGTYDINGALPFEPPENYAMFTGVSVQTHTIHGKPVTLEEAQKRYKELTPEELFLPKDIKYTGEIIMWSNREGKLTPRSGRGIQIPLQIE